MAHPDRIHLEENRNHHKDELYAQWAEKNHAEIIRSTVKTIMLSLTAFAFGLVAWVILINVALSAIASADYPEACEGLTPGECTAYFQDASR